MSIELTEEQQRTLDAGQETPARVVDPRTQETYVLVPAEVYDRLKALVSPEDDDSMARALYPHMWEVFGREGWDDPEMDVYNDPDYPKRP